MEVNGYIMSKKLVSETGGKFGKVRQHLLHPQKIDWSLPTIVSQKDLKIDSKQFEVFMDQNQDDDLPDLIPIIQQDFYHHHDHQKIPLSIPLSIPLRQKDLTIDFDSKQVIHQVNCSKQEAMHQTNCSKEEAMHQINCLKQALDQTNSSEEEEIDQTNCSEEEAMDAVVKKHGDVANAISSLPKEFNMEDVELVMYETCCSKQEAINALKKNHGDVIDAILSVMEYI